MNTRLNVLLRLQTPLAHLSDTVPRTKKACHSVCRTGWRMLSTDASKASPWLSQGLEVRARKASVGSGQWLRIKQLTLPPLEIPQVCAWSTMQSVCRLQLIWTSSTQQTNATSLKQTCIKQKQLVRLLWSVVVKMEPPNLVPPEQWIPQNLFHCKILPPPSPENLDHPLQMIWLSQNSMLLQSLDPSGDKVVWINQSEL